MLYCGLRTMGYPRGCSAIYSVLWTKMYEVVTLGNLGYTSCAVSTVSENGSEVYILMVYRSYESFVNRSLF